MKTNTIKPEKNSGHPKVARPVHHYWFGGLLPGTLLVLILFTGPTVFAQPASNTYIVTKTVDTNGSCDTGDCSLREAIMAANADGVPSLIKFDFATGSAPYTIFVRGSALPPIIDPETEINGLEDNGYVLGDVIVDGTLLAGPIDGFTIMGTGTGISGLQIQNFGGNGINAGDTGSTITVGISNTIIIDNRGSAIFSPIHLNLGVDGCFLGTNPDYDAGLGNGAYGIDYNSSAFETPPLFRVTNTAIASNGNGGITCSGRVVFAISDNVIGTNPAGTADLRTGTSGVAISSNDAGGSISNNIVGYSGRGIAATASILTTISENSLICNEIFGIGRSGSTLEVEITDAGTSTISGTSNVSGGTIEVFTHSTAGCGSAVPCQGRTFLGATTVAAAGGVWSLDVSGLVGLGDVITATVTDGSTAIPTTSEFADCVTISCPQITTTIDETPSCVATNNGSLTANPTGGQAPYQFIWSNGGGTATISDLAPGTYSVTVLDALGCRSFGAGEVAEIPGPTANAGPDQLICAGTETVLSATASGGNAPYSFEWSTGESGPSITVSPSESTFYNVTATDSRGCADADQVIIRIDPGPQPPDAGPDQTLCQGQTANLQGTIGGDPNGAGMWTASVAGGTFSPDAGTLNVMYTPPAGVTTVTLTLSTTSGTADCPDLSDEMVISYTEGLTVDAGPDQTVCVDSPTTLAGSVGGNGAVSGGWTPSVAGGSFSPDSLDLNAVYTPPAGAGSVVLTLLAVDASGLGLCPEVRDQMTITYTENEAAVDAGPDQFICESDVVTLDGSFGGTATNAQWSSDGDGTFADITDPQTTYTPGPADLGAQGVTLSLTTGAVQGCPPVSDDVDIRIIAAPTYTLTGIDPSTCGDPDGSILINGLLPGAAHGVSYVFAGAVVQFSVDASAGGTISIDNLGDGIYQDITVTDNNGCSGSSQTLTLNSPDGPEVSADPAAFCIGSTGTVSGNAVGGTPPYTHEWIDQNSGSASGYTLGNTTDQTLNIDAGSALAGSIDLLYRVTDANGCTASAAVELNILNGPEVAVIQLDSASAASTADGRAELSLSGGTAPYSYSWTGPSSGTINGVNAGNVVIDNLLTGSYSLQLNDANGCTASLRFRIGVTTSGGGECTTEAGSLEEVAGGVQACSSTAVELVHNGDEFLDPNDALVFVLKETSGIVVKTNTVPVFEYDPATMSLNTQYLAAARAGNTSGAADTVDPADPCLSESNTVSIVFQESVTGVLNFLQGEETLCQGEELILSTNNLGSIEYFWLTPARDTLRTNEPMVILPNIQPEDAGDYYVIARDGDCLNDQTGPFSLIVNGLPAGTPICAGDDQTVCERTASLQACDPGSGNGFWVSLSGATLNNSGSATTAVSDLEPGENLFVWTVEIPECGAVGTDTVSVLYESSLFAQPDAFVLERANTEIFMDILKNDNIASGAEIELTALTQPGFGTLETLANGFRYYENEQRRGTVEFVYQVCYLGGMCTGTCDTASVQIEVLNLPYLPDGITPDGDGRNDELTVLGYTPGDSDLRLQLTIANQWGEIIFQSNDYAGSEPWDGTFNGKPVPQGAYYCHLKTIVSEGEFERTQTVYVVR